MLALRIAQETLHARANIGQITASYSPKPGVGIALTALGSGFQSREYMILLRTKLSVY